MEYRKNNLVIKHRVSNQLVRFFLRNGCFRVPKKILRKKDRKRYKKGYEIRFIANNEKEFGKIKTLLRAYSFKFGRSFKKRSQIVLPVYGRDAVEKFYKFL